MQCKTNDLIFAHKLPQTAAEGIVQLTRSFDAVLNEAFTNPASKVVQIRAALVPVPSPDKWGGLRQEGHPA